MLLNHVDEIFHNAFGLVVYLGGPFVERARRARGEILVLHPLELVQYRAGRRFVELYDIARSGVPLDEFELQSFVEKLEEINAFLEVDRSVLYRVEEEYQPRVYVKGYTDTNELEGSIIIAYGQQMKIVSGRSIEENPETPIFESINETEWVAKFGKNTPFLRPNGEVAFILVDPREFRVVECDDE